ncbi:hypothetical protein PR202_gb18850 [Eleusine coracana subsp. coracana]|uniref:Transmembrane protein 135 N-terminal domain-containing protein n=1 Tax=Eleusine coracana subsp. coracana TaxID=191504 RepID=A0AAV5F6P0_ELECO|nr:hypothetical protein PR202_gb18850 [Eleusine coracana subsp. coracana]
MAPELTEDPQCAANGYCAASPEKPRAGGYYRPVAPPAPVAGDGELLWLRRCLEAAAKGFAIGAGLKGGLAIFSVLVRLRSRRTPRSRKAGSMTNEEAIVLAVKETVRYGMFLGTFAGSYVSVDECIAAIWGRKRSAYILKQDSLPSSYKSFLNKHGGKDLVILQGVKEIVNHTPLSNLAGIEKYYKSVGVDLKLDPNMKVPCSIVHGNQSCSGHFLSFLLQAYGRALPVYVPVYLVPALVVHRQDLMKRPYTIMGKSLLGTARSSLFLSVYCASAWAWTCLLFRIFQSCNTPLVILGTFPTGLALFIEKKSRRIEISLYCLARAIESFFTCMTDAGLCPPILQIKRADVVVFSMATSVIMHCYAQEREVFRSKYLNVLDWVFGVPPPSDTEGKNCYQPDDEAKKC